MDVESFPQYLRIALDIASRIVDGELKEHQKLTGRSLLSSQYSVSPETIRKALRLLADMKVTEIKESPNSTLCSQLNILYNQPNTVNNHLEAPQ